MILLVDLKKVVHKYIIFNYFSLEFIFHQATKSFGFELIQHVCYNKFTVHKTQNSSTTSFDDIHGPFSFSLIVSTTFEKEHQFTDIWTSPKNFTINLLMELFRVKVF